MKVFLGGTVNGSKWRDSLISDLKIDFFNPVVDDWNEEAYKRELYERQHCDFCLYVLTPKITGFYALAEVTDDSFKRPDRTIFCYLAKDGKDKFDQEQINAMEALGKRVEENGGIWYHSLNEVANFLNSGKAQQIIKKKEGEDFDDVFISYGRRHSKGFATKLHNALVKENFNVWFDQNDIPLGVDFQEQINDGISKAHNFVFIISPHSIRSEYCLREIELAVKLNKRIIPLLHVDPVNEMENIHPAIAKINWVYIREEADENLEHSRWKQIDDFYASFQGLIQLIGNHAEYVEKHTRLLSKALEWDKNKRDTKFLLVGKERQEAEKWLAREFKKGQPPCIPTDLHCEYICESKKNGENLMTEAFIAYSAENKEIKDQISKALARFGITTWLHNKDIKSGQNFDKAILEGIIQADNFLFFITKESIVSEYCIKELEYAQNFNKRIIPLLIEEIEEDVIPKKISQLQYINFCETNPQEFQAGVQALIIELNKEKGYFQKHKRYLSQAIKWEEQGKNESMLLRGYNLQDAETWLEIGKRREDYQPTKIHDLFISTSGSKRLQLSNEVFISYSRADGDFARKLNEALQIQGKTTWFDQESIASGSDFQTEIFHGIESSDNFLFIISPDSVKSPYCADEVEYAHRLNKRFVTINHRKTPYLHPTLAAVQWIDFSENDFNESFNSLVNALDVDRGHVQNHTKWSQRAIEWEENSKNPGLLLNGMELGSAESWLKEAEKNLKKPFPTTLQVEFIRASSIKTRKENKRKLILTTMVIVMASLFAISGFLAYVAYQEKKEVSQQANFARIKAEEAQLAKLEAFKQKETADSLRIIAQEETKKASEAKILAEKASKEAIAAKIKAEEALKQAVELRKIAEQNAQEARKQTLLARQNAMRAEEERQNALKALEEALRQQDLAEEQRILAMEKSQEARKNYLEAEKQKALADSVALVARQQLEIVQQSKELAEESKAETERIALLNEAKILSIKALELFNNGNLEDSKLLALHAFFINEENKGPQQLPENYTVLNALSQFDTRDKSTGHKFQVKAIDYNDNHQILATGDRSGIIYLRRFFPGQVMRRLSVLKIDSGVTQLVISQEGDFMLAGSTGGEILLWEMDKAKFLPKFKNPILAGKHRTAINHIEFVQVPGSKKMYFAASDSEKITFWSLENGKPLQIGSVNQRGTIGFSISKVDDKNFLLAIGKGNNIEILGVTLSGKENNLSFKNIKNIQYNSKNYRLSAGNLSKVAFSPNGNYLISGTNSGAIEVWDGKSFELVTTLIGHTAPINVLKFSENGRKIISGGDDKTARVWTVDNMNRSNPLILRNKTNIWDLTFVQNESKILTVGEGNEFLFWGANSRIIADELCKTVNKKFTKSEFEKYSRFQVNYQNSNCVSFDEN
ncbi:TIR domain-containing protein [Flexithrix dorotheae]|uniref:TIR domain-containing protein n=1 Tax=Flexithrix dorotheae TaxID=70993 RepID=UPI00035F8FEC|nr:TIR domain-containing protein [Flexithrix dorotheae]